jgi:flagellin-like protein
MRKGVSPIVSTVLLTAIVVVVGTTIFLWGAMVLGLFSQNVYISNTLKGEQLLESFIIEHVILTKPHNITIYIRNTGTEDVKLTSLYVYNTQNTSQFVQVSLDSYNFIVYSGKIGNITINLPVSWSWVNGNVYHIKVVSQRGNYDETEVRA